MDEEGKKQDNQQTSTEKAATVGLKVAANSLAPGIGGKAVSIASKTRIGQKIIRKTARAVGNVPGLKTATTLDKAGLPDMADGTSHLIGNVPTGTTNINGAPSLTNNGQTIDKSKINSGDGNSGSKSNSKKSAVSSNLIEKKKKKLLIYLLVGAVGLALAGGLLFVIVSAVRAPFAAVENFIDNIFNSEETGITEEEEAEIDESYKNYLCGDDSSDECVEKYEDYIKSEKDFLDRFKSISKAYNLTTRQQKILYQTIVFGYSIDEINPNDTYNIDTTSDSEDNIYEKEKDTIKDLAQEFNGYEENFYDYLITSDFFDDRRPLSNYYSEYAASVGLNADNISHWSDDDKQKVRKKIVKDIKGMMSDYFKDDKKKTFTAEKTVTYNSFAWWPIGSLITKTINFRNKIIEFASNTPAYTSISSPFGYRTHPVTGKQGTFHNGIDIPAALNTPVIACLKGTVVEINNTCSTTGSKGCGSGYGNYVKVKTPSGLSYLYGHLAKDSIKVSVGGEVEQGQVLAGVGSSGTSTGYHLHAAIITTAGEFVNPLDYLDPNNTRGVITSTAPSTGSGKIDDSGIPDQWKNAFKFIAFNEGGFSESNKVICSLDKLPTSRYGTLLYHRKEVYANNGFDLVNIPVYEKVEKNGKISFNKLPDYSNYCSDIELYDENGNAIEKGRFVDEIPEKVAKAGFVDLMEYFANDVKKWASKNGVTLSKNQVDAIVSLSWSGPAALEKFKEMYKKYGYNNEKICSNWWRSYLVTSSAAEAQGNNVNEGLKNRRNRECNLFLTGDYGEAIK